jgi:hypothetical protein
VWGKKVHIVPSPSSSSMANIIQPDGLGSTQPCLNTLESERCVGMRETCSGNEEVLVDKMDIVDHRLTSTALLM